MDFTSNDPHLKHFFPLKIFQLCVFPVENSGCFMTLDVINKKHIGNLLKSNEFNSWKLSIEVAEKKDQSKDLDALQPWPILTSRLVTARCFGISYKTPLVKMIVTWVYRENSKLDEAISKDQPAKVFSEKKGTL